MKLSIIIPVYNTISYLNECINSVLSQNSEDIEILLIDDGSTDGSYEFCCEKFADNKQVRLFTKKNEGLAITRNFGIQQSRGEYITFLDSDDYWSPNMAKQLLEKCDKADIVVFDYKELSSNGELFYPNFLSKYPYSISVSGVEFLQEVLTLDKNYPWYAWRYAIKMDLIKNTRFQFSNIRTYEDVASIWKLLTTAEAVNVLACPLYVYRTNRINSLTQGAKLSSELDKLTAIQKNINDITLDKCLSIPLKKLLCNNFSTMYYSSLILVNSLKEGKERRKLFQTLKNLKWIMNYTISGKQRLVSIGVRVVGIHISAILLHFRKIIRK